MRFKIALAISCVTFVLLLVNFVLEIGSGDWIVSIVIGAWLLPLSVVGVLLARRDKNVIIWISGCDTSLLGA